MIKEEFKDVEKVWGREFWLVNNDHYCAKLLVVDENATCSYHYHKKKKETFYTIEGYVKLTINGKDCILAPFSNPRTIEPGDKHKFYGLTNAVILEVSTHHEDSDVVRLEPSKAGKEDVV